MVILLKDQNGLQSYPQIVAITVATPKVGARLVANRPQSSPRRRPVKAIAGPSGSVRWFLCVPEGPLLGAPARMFK